MRKIEQDLLNAIHNGRHVTLANTAYNADTGVVTLHGHHIATIDGNGRATANRHTFALWPTRVTRSRLQALGIDASIRNFTAVIDGEVCI